MMVESRVVVVVVGSIVVLVVVLVALTIAVPNFAIVGIRNDALVR
jgi:hypothetical protein